MKKIILVSVLHLVLSNSFAQPNPKQHIQDSVIGWWQKLSIPKPKPPTKTQPLTIEQQKHLVNIIEWMQRSYTPIGGIGTYKLKFYNSKDPDYNPFAYGVEFRVWNVSFAPPWLEANGNFIPVSEEYTRYDINANGIPGSYPISFINTTTQYVFTWPPNSYGVNGNLARETSLTDNPNTRKFITRVNEYNTVFLAPENKLPFIPVSKGQLLQFAEAAVDKEIQRKKIAIEGKWPGNIKAQNEAFEYERRKLEKTRIAIQNLKEKYKNSLNEHAIIHDMQPTLASFDGYMDPFEIKPIEQTNKVYFPIYMIDSSVLEKCKGNQPQWIAVSFPYTTKEDGNQEYEMYRSLMEHFNYEYVQDYFFYPDKINGVSYKPVNPELLIATLEGFSRKSYRQNPGSINTLSGSTYFFDDFTKNAVGSNPAGWYFSTSGKHALVTVVKDKPGKWVQLGYNNPLSSPLMKTPLPQNFTLDYDIATSSFSSSSGGSITLYLSTFPLNKDGTENKSGHGTAITVTITAGNEADYINNNYRGESKIEIHAKPRVNIENNSEGIYFTSQVLDFTNNKTNAHVTFQLKNGKLKLFLNEKLIALSDNFKMAYGKACTSCDLPSNSMFNTISWKNTTNNYDYVNVYVSNIKITKD